MTREQRKPVEQPPAVHVRGVARADTLFSDIRSDLRMLDMFDPSDPGDAELLRAGIGDTLGAALTELADVLGGDPATWTWGALHRTELRHTVFGNDPSASESWRALPSVPRAGSGDPVGLSGYDPSFNTVMGSSFRIAVDVEEWDATLVLNSPGQSGGSAVGALRRSARPLGRGRGVPAGLHPGRGRGGGREPAAAGPPRGRLGVRLRSENRVHRRAAGAHLSRYHRSRGARCSRGGTEHDARVRAMWTVDEDRRCERGHLLVGDRVRVRIGYVSSGPMVP